MHSEFPFASAGIELTTHRHRRTFSHSPQRKRNDKRRFDSLAYEGRHVDAFGSKQPLSTALGVLDMARSIRSNSRHLASGELGYHVLDILVSIEEAIESRSTVEVSSTVEPIPLLSEDWDPIRVTL
jgi:predicted dehydrogenase